MTTIEQKAVARLECKFDSVDDTDGKMTFSGYGSVFGNVDSYADDFDTARALANSIRTKVDGYRDKEVQELALISEQDMSDLVSTPGRTRIMMEFKIAHSE